MTRSGRMTTHPVSSTKITLASAAMPGVVSVRPLHDVGDSELPMPLPVICAVMHAALKIANASVSSHAERKEANGEDVLDTFRPRGGDQHQRTEQHGDAERDQQPRQTRADRPIQIRCVVGVAGRRDRRWSSRSTVRCRDVEPAAPAW